MSMNKHRFKVVWGAIERRGRTMWTRVGLAWPGRDGVLFARLSVFPMSGRICIKDGHDEDRESIALMMEEAAE